MKRQQHKAKKEQKIRYWNKQLWEINSTLEVHFGEPTHTTAFSSPANDQKIERCSASSHDEGLDINPFVLSSSINYFLLKFQLLV